MVDLMALKSISSESTGIQKRRVEALIRRIRAAVRYFVGTAK